MIDKVFTTEGFLEIAIESWLGWDLSPWSLNSIQTLLPTKLSCHELNLHSEPTLYSYPNFISLFSVQISFQPFSLSVTTFALSNLSKISHRYHVNSGIYIYIYICIYIHKIGLRRNYLHKYNTLRRNFRCFMYKIWEVSTYFWEI